MKQFLFKLIPPRPSFPFDMNDEEKAIMEEHKQYLGGLCQKGKVIVFGPVLDPNGPWGLAILEVESEEEATEIGNADPSVIAGVNTFIAYPMFVGMTRPCV